MSNNSSLIPGYHVYGEHVGCVLRTFQQVAVNYHSLFLIAIFVLEIGPSRSCLIVL